MREVPLVDVDISMSTLSTQEGQVTHINSVLDPYLLNFLPKSLATTSIHLTIVAIIAWYLSKVIWNFLDQISKISHSTDRQRKDT